MPDVGSLVEKVRSKNAGPFWVTVDVFCGSPDAFKRVSKGLANANVASIFGTDTQTLKRFDIAELNVVKFSFPRPEIQGTVADRDMHGAAWAVLLAEAEVE
jgi:hypothetical protein